MGVRQGAMEDLAMNGAVDTSFWRGRRVLLTGHSGFKGSWLTLWLNRLGALVTGVSLPPATSPNLYDEAAIGTLCVSHFCDIRDQDALAKLIPMARPEIVLHLAAQPLVRASYREPRETFATNIMGTANVLDALRGLDGVRVAVMVTTDKVYRDSPVHRPYGEEDALGGHDPYSASKAACEIVIASYRDVFLAAQGVAVASARAGNVIGGGDWSQDRLIPDAVRAWEAGQPLLVRMPHAVRPWQHVLEPLYGYLRLAEKLWQEPGLAGAYNFGPNLDDAVAVWDVVELARRAYGEGRVHYAKDSEGPHESGWLGLAVGKARKLLGVTPVWALDDAVARTLAWYHKRQKGADTRDLCLADISAFETDASNPSRTPERKTASV